MFDELLSHPFCCRIFVITTDQEFLLIQCIHIRNTEAEEAQSSLALIQRAENAPSGKDGKRVLEVPLGIEAVGKYKKALMFYHKL
ncbi:hypothetical protein CU097_001388 [Rhizopus azygosporus]|uniref:Uncharacterized protein n=1 Tax=Rhizopus azygosporus TaxID=86630 RepID=A0A367JZ71_RHIAZ|nr:hypothetical protein CU097_001388 [Rhizopus azygosporus]